MDKDFVMLKAQFEALRTIFMTNITYTMATDSRGKTDPDKVWLYKFLLWKFERENLSPFSFSDYSESSLDAHEIESVNERRFHLQILETIACIKGRLEGYKELEIPFHCLHSDNILFAQKVLRVSEGHSEAELIAAIKTVSS